MAAGFLPHEEDKHSAAWRGCDSQVLYHSFPLLFYSIFFLHFTVPFHYTIPSPCFLVNLFFFRCSYNSTGVNHETHIGGTAGDEMCNLYIMYFTGTFCAIFQILAPSGALYVTMSHCVIGQEDPGHFLFHSSQCHYVTTIAQNC